ncbi:MAG: M3 family oligoendopeptidase [Saprospiraceae bacterium]
MTNRAQDASAPPITFKNYAYRRPDLDALQSKTEDLIAAFGAADSAETQIRLMRRFNRLFAEFRSMANLCYVRHSQDTRDPFYEAENTFFDENMPKFEALTTRVNEALLASPFRPAIEQRFGSQIFVLADLARRAFSPEVVGELQQENALSTAYSRLKSQAKIECQGQTFNLSSIYALEVSPERETRRAAAEAKWRFFEKNRDRVEGIFDEMVALRTRIAHKLGAPNFIPIGYARMGRSDYDPDMVAVFREEVRRYITPLASELYERQRRRLGLERLLYYDEEFKFMTGNPRPKGAPEQIISHAADMYAQLSKDTGRFFAHLQNAELMDLVNRDGKITGGYCTYISKYRAPFIFANFNGTSADVDVLTHEAGHAFQVWMSRKQPFEEYYWPTSDAAEIHSMSMEFFTRPWMSGFFGEADAVKYDFMHLSSAIQFIPYGVAVDEFQHRVYAQPDLSPQARNEIWAELERRYLPHRDYGDNVFLRSGGFWQKQNHIFNSPFYYIDYTLAQICAFQFWMKDREDHARAWRDYVRLCKAGGSRSFLQLTELAGLESPFKSGALARMADMLRQHMAAIDDSGF